MLDLSCQTKLITYMKCRNVYSNRLLPNEANKELCLRVTNSKVKGIVIFWSKVCSLQRSDFFQCLVLLQSDRVDTSCSEFLHNYLSTRPVLQMWLLSAYTERYLEEIILWRKCGSFLHCLSFCYWVYRKWFALLVKEMNWNERHM